MHVSGHFYASAAFYLDTEIPVRVFRCSPGLDFTYCHGGSCVSVGNRITAFPHEISYVADRGFKFNGQTLTRKALQSNEVALLTCLSSAVGVARERIDLPC